MGGGGAREVGRGDRTRMAVKGDVKERRTNNVYRTRSVMTHEKIQ